VIEVVEQFWIAMQRNDWEAAAEHLVEDIEVDWPCSGERIVGRASYVAVQQTYPTTTGRWTFEIHRLLGDAPTVVSEVTVSDGVQSARAIVFSEVVGDQIVRQVEYWPTAYEPPAERAHLVQRIPPIP
jgi:limonene-1,2-epoxide hydrolase